MCEKVHANKKIILTKHNQTEDADYFLTHIFSKATFQITFCLKNLLIIFWKKNTFFGSPHPHLKILFYLQTLPLSPANIHCSFSLNFKSHN